MKRVIAFLIIAVLGLASISLAQKTEVIFWEAMEAKLGTTLQTITNIFNKEHPNIDVKLVFVGNGDQLDSKILAAAQANTLPTIAQVYPAWAAALVAQGVVTPMDSFPDFTTVASQLYPSIINMSKINGRVYTLPFNQSVYVLYYRPMMLAQAGLTPPKTMDELAQDAKLLTVVQNGKTVRYGLGFRTTYGVLTAVARQFGGGKYITPEGSLIINSPQNVAALTFLVNLVKEGYAYAKFDYFDNELTTSSVAMLIGEGADLPFDLSDIAGQKDGIEMASFPVGISDQKSPLFRGQTLVIFNTATKDQQNAAWEYVKFLLSPAVQIYWAMNTNYSPLNKTVVSLDQWNLFAQGTSYNPSAIVDGLANGISYSENLPWWPSVIDNIRTAVENAVHFTMTPQQALDWAQQQSIIVQQKYLGK
ncbi:ABC transporter substrate-binding protein [Athalassotoga saccharophila]|uniref:ABC transporter substrate-binding protein n=1 Tax=Athalassotoga saccharophila TaxID=1441386 RepID=UPI00137A6CBC|nr:ABC transporter substrate-binding protein [Athalassotoga saccharophila]BBJ28246.1 sn-glycerol-3-phosphate-binding periplasmic protein UgpB [Athalassotoga saccharophila]